MSDQEEDNQKLNDLFKKASSEGFSEEDAFEKEALDGYALMESENEVMDLKKSLDARMYTEVFAKEKPKNRRTFWLAAAVFVGVIGFSIYFIPNFFESKEKEMALHASEDKQLPEINSTIPTPSIELENSSKAPQLSTTAKQDSHRASSTAKLSSHDTKQEEDLASPTANSVSFEGEKTKYIKMEPSLSKESAHAEDDSGNSAVSSLDGLSDNSSSRSEGAILLEEKSRNTATNTASKKTASESLAPPANEELVSVTEVAIATGSRYKQAATCTYVGGSVQLNKELKTLLEAENILKSFDAVLSLNQKALVEKVKFTNSFDLTTAEKEKIILILKSLTRFQVSGINGKKELVEYRLEYRP